LGGLLPGGGRHGRSGRCTRWSGWSGLCRGAACAALRYVWLLRYTFGLVCIFVRTPFIPTRLGGLLPGGGRRGRSGRCTRWSGWSGLCRDPACAALRYVCFLRYTFGLICVLVGPPFFLASLDCL